jgi:hypothetical protein
MRPLLPTTVVLSLSFAIALAAGPTPAFRTRAEATAAEEAGPDGRAIRTTSGVRFLFHSLLLLREQITVRETDGIDSQNAQVEVTAFTSDKARYDKQAWSFKAPGNRAELWSGMGERYYRATLSGAGGAEDLHTLLSLRTGERLLVHTGDPVEVDIPNTKIRRLVTYHSSQAALAPSSVPGVKDLCGVLTLSSPGGAVARVAVVGVDSKWTPKITLVADGKTEEEPRNLRLWGLRGGPPRTAIGGFRVRLRFSEGDAEATVPVEDDAFQVDRATVSRPTLMLVVIGK